MKSDGKSKAVQIEQFEVPDLKHLAKLYREAIVNADITLASAAEAAAMQTSAAEGALAEAIAITRFVDEAAV